MENTPAEIVKALLINPSGCLFTNPDLNQAWPLYLSSMPDGTGIPDNSAALYDTTGMVKARLLASNKIIQKYGVQLKIRSLVYQDGFTRLSEASDQLNLVKRQTVVISSNSYLVDTIILSSPVVSMGQDERRRALCSVNFLVWLDEN